MIDVKYTIPGTGSMGGVKKKDEEMKRPMHYSLEPLAHARSAWWIDCSVVSSRLKSVLLQ